MTPWGIVLRYGNEPWTPIAPLKIGIPSRCHSFNRQCVHRSHQVICSAAVEPYFPSTTDGVLINIPQDKTVSFPYLGVFPNGEPFEGEVHLVCDVVG